jgi:hypothetical protein
MLMKLTPMACIYKNIAIVNSDSSSKCMFLSELIILAKAKNIPYNHNL